MKYKRKGSKALRLRDAPDEKKPKATGELELFKKIALERSYWDEYKWCMAKHLSIDGQECEKPIALEDLQPINFAHIKPKGMFPELRLDPSNIEIVSKRYHFYEHNQQILQEDSRN